MKPILAILILMFVFSCKKDEEDDLPTTTDPTTSCALNSGSFNLSIGGNNHEMVLDDNTQFSILYGWYGDDLNSFIVNAVDQNNKDIDVELNLPGEITVGSHSFSEGMNDAFSFSVDTFSCYVSEVTFNVTESNLITEEGIYKPVVSTFTGTAHSFPWSSSYPPIDTLAFSGAFCLNGIILH